MALSVAVAVVLLGGIMAVVESGRMDARRREAETRAVEIARRIAKVAPADLARVAPAIEALDPNVAAVVFLDPEWTVLARHTSAQVQAPASDDLARLAQPGYGGRPGWKLVNLNIETTSGRVQYRLRMAYSLDGVEQQNAGDRWHLLLNLALLALFGVVAALVLADRIATPLQRLVAGMRKVQYGELGSQVRVSGSGEIAEIARAFNEMSTELRSRERLRMNFARFVSSAVADKVISENRTVRLGGERRMVTVLFADIRGFTAIAANQPPEKVVALLNECFRTLVDVIPRYGGTLDKFIGDGLLAVFNAPTDVPVHEICAVMAGLEMQSVMERVNEQRRLSGQQELRLGIGINTGEAVAGTFGSERRLEYTVIGSAVNLAQRIEDHARGGELLIGEATYQAVRHLVEAEGQEPATLKGLDTPVHLYKVVGLAAGVRGMLDSPARAAAQG